MGLREDYLHRNAKRTAVKTGRPKGQRVVVTGPRAQTVGEDNSATQRQVYDLGGLAEGTCPTCGRPYCPVCGKPIPVSAKVCGPACRAKKWRKRNA